MVLILTRRDLITASRHNAIKFIGVADFAGHTSRPILFADLVLFVGTFEDDNPFEAAQFKVLKNRRNDFGKVFPLSEMKTYINNNLLA